MSEEILGVQLREDILKELRELDARKLLLNQRLTAVNKEVSKLARARDVTAGRTNSCPDAHWEDRG